MSSAPAVLHAGLKHRSRHLQLNKTKKTKQKETEASNTFSKMKHEHTDSITSFDYATMHYYIYYTAFSEKHQSISYPAAKTPKTQKVKGFYYHSSWRYVWVWKNFAYLGFFAKVPVSVRSVIPCFWGSLNIMISISGVVFGVFFSLEYDEWSWWRVRSTEVWLTSSLWCYS